MMLRRLRLIEVGEKLENSTHGVEQLCSEILAETSKYGEKLSIQDSETYRMTNGYNENASFP